uniref:Uncharacterized protein n=1 Tax=Anguilla anguilla TaxID=7936 RepID=A0A0E9UBI4_ANGAN
MQTHPPQNLPPPILNDTE